MGYEAHGALPDPPQVLQGLGPVLDIEALLVLLVMRQDQGRLVRLRDGEVGLGIDRGLLCCRIVP
jgi:hypothetical protein